MIANLEPKHPEGPKKMTEPKVQFIKALQKAQQEFPSLGKTKEVGVGKFGYSYLPLEQMLSKIQPVLHKNGFHLSQLFGYTETGETIIRTKLVHIGGHEEVSELPLFIPPRDMQKKNEAHVWGSSVTYQRRYSIKLILGLETDMDNNMELEPEKPHRSRQAAPPQNVFIAAKAAIEKETDFERLLSHESNLEVRYTQGKITQEEYNHLSSILKEKKAELTA